MLLNPKLEKLMNIQYTNDVSSALLYQNIAGFYDDRHFSGFAKYFTKSAEEELGHAKKFYDFINLRDGRAIISGIPNKDLQFNDGTDLLMPFYDALKHEQQVSTYINELCDVALEMKDHGAYKFLQEMFEEQQEEEIRFINLIAELELVKNDGGDLLRISHRIGGEDD